MGQVGFWPNKETKIMASERADTTEDNYAERVLRNEGRLIGLEGLVRETREADRKLIEQRSESLAQELERRADSLLELVTARADAVLALSKEERESDRNEVQVLFSESEKRWVVHLEMLREVYSTAIKKNYEQSTEAITALEQRVTASHTALEQMVRQWRESDREARQLFSAELDKHLDVLNHSTERMATFQAGSVTRELWQSEKDASIAREGLLRDQIITLDRTTLTLMPVAQAEKAHAEILSRSDLAVAAAAAVLETKIITLSEKVDDLKLSRAAETGKGQGQNAVWAWLVTAVTVLISIILLANTFLSGGATP